MVCPARGLPLSWSMSGRVIQVGPGWGYPVPGPDWATSILWSGPGQGYPLPPESTWEQGLGRDRGPEGGVPPRNDLEPETGKGPTPHPQTDTHQ